MVWAPWFDFLGSQTQKGLTACLSCIRREILCHCTRDTLDTAEALYACGTVDVSPGRPRKLQIMAFRKQNTRVQNVGFRSIPGHSPVYPRFVR